MTAVFLGDAQATGPRLRGVPLWRGLGAGGTLGVRGMPLLLGSGRAESRGQPQAVGADRGDVPTPAVSRVLAGMLGASRGCSVVLGEQGRSSRLASAAGFGERGRRSCRAGCDKTGR